MCQELHAQYDLFDTHGHLFSDDVPLTLHENPAEDLLQQTKGNVDHFVRRYDATRTPSPAPLDSSFFDILLRSLTFCHGNADVYAGEILS